MRHELECSHFHAAATNQKQRPAKEECHLFQHRMNPGDLWKAGVELHLSFQKCIAVQHIYLDPPKRCLQITWLLMAFLYLYRSSNVFFYETSQEKTDMLHRWKRDTIKLIHQSLHKSHNCWKAFFSTIPSASGSVITRLSTCLPQKSDRRRDTTTSTSIRCTENHDHDDPLGQCA